MTSLSPTSTATRCNTWAETEAVIAAAIGADAADGPVVADAGVIVEAEVAEATAAVPGTERKNKSREEDPRRTNRGFFCRVTKT